MLKLILLTLSLIAIWKILKLLNIAISAIIQYFHVSNFRRTNLSLYQLLLRGDFANPFFTFTFAFTLRLLTAFLFVLLLKFLIGHTFKLDFDWISFVFTLLNMFLYASCTYNPNDYNSMHFKEERDYINESMNPNIQLFELFAAFLGAFIGYFSCI